MIKVSNLGKRYVIAHNQHRRGGYRRLSEDLAQAVTWPVRTLIASRNGNPASRSSSEEFWALRDVSFEIAKGEVVGVIGPNGAGKSTLLKLLSRITEPTTGRIELNGRLASLLEVGTGFHPELTGRENIYMNGSILGMSRGEIRRKFDEIVDFSGVEKFLDTPVKRYSSGMQVRLAFAVAAHLDPEIVVVDEVLAVGDIEFQRKCLGKMEDVAKSGRTIIFVSHNMTAIKSLCSRAILLREGRIASIGSTKKVVENYLIAGWKMATSGIVPDDAPRIGTGTARVRSVSLNTLNNLDTQELYFKQPFRVVAEVEVLEDIFDAFFEVSVSTRDLLQVTNSSTMDNDGHSVVIRKGYHQFTVSFDFVLFPGQYCIGVNIFHYNGTSMDWVQRALDFEVHQAAEEANDGYRWGTDVRGFIRPVGKWTPPQPIEVLRNNIV